MLFIGDARQQQREGGKPASFQGDAQHDQQHRARAREREQSDKGQPETDADHRADRAAARDP